MKYWFLKLLIRQGEYEFYSMSTHKQQANEKDFDMATFSEAYAADFYGCPDDPDDTGGSYYFDCGNLCVEVYSRQEVTKKEYETLGKFI